MALDSYWWIFLLEFSASLIIIFFTVPMTAKKFKKAGLKGVNLHSKSKEEVPESLGLLTGMVITIIIILMSFLVKPYIDLIYTTLMSVALALLLGFIDDFLSIRWRYKLLIPLIAAIPLILNYSGATSVDVPLIGAVELGLIYPLLVIPLITVYMANSINIYAGINLLEVGQVIVLTSVIVVLAAMTSNLLALYMAAPFLGGCIALAWFNKYPAKIFVGNSFTYFAGMFLITVAVFSNMEKLFILCTFPQFINFLYSIKDFAKKTPRHRVPSYDEGTGLLRDSGNHTILNLVLRVRGPMSERGLSAILIVIQLVNALFVLGGWLLLTYI